MNFFEIISSTYREFKIIHGIKKFIVYEGVKSHVFDTLTEAHEWIDKYYQERGN